MPNRAPARVMTVGGLPAPRLRFDRTAVGLVRRLQTALARSVPVGRTVIVTITAPIWQDSKTGAVLEERIRGLLAGRRSRLQATIHGNRIEVRVLKGGTHRTSRLIGFVHNPKPGPALLFEVTRALLARAGKGQGSRSGERWLIRPNREGRALLETLRQAGTALRARSALRGILLAEDVSRRAR
jgi:hypothetical protein